MISFSDHFLFVPPLFVVDVDTQRKTTETLRQSLTIFKLGGRPVSSIPRQLRIFTRISERRSSSSRKRFR